MRLARPIPLFVCCFGAQFLIFPIYIYRLGLKEQMLSSQMGDAYRAYQKRTWRLIPLVY